MLIYYFLKSIGIKTWTPMQRKTYAMLSQLDARELDDIGIAPYQIRDIVNKLESA